MLHLLLGVISVLCLDPLVLSGLGGGVEARCNPVAPNAAQDSILASLTPAGPPAAEVSEDHAGKLLRVRNFIVENRSVTILFEEGATAPHLRHVCVVTSNDLNSAETRRALGWSLQRVLDVVYLRPLPFQARN